MLFILGNSSIQHEEFTKNSYVITIFFTIFFMIFFRCDFNNEFYYGLWLKTTNSAMISSKAMN